MSRKIAYEARVRNEQAHYSALLGLGAQSSCADVQKVEPSVAAFEFALEKYAPYIASRMPHANLEAYAVEYINCATDLVHMLSLGAGTGDWELQVARKAARPVEVTVVDLNEELMRKAQRVAAEQGIRLHTVVNDVNTMRIDRCQYDLIVCRSSLHHFVAIEHVMEQIKHGLTTAGEFLVMGEVIGRNGLVLYPETEAVAQRIFSSLPTRLRFNHYSGMTDDTVPNYDHSRGSFEAIRSEDILPLLLQTFTPVEYVAIDAFVSLLLDWRYGPNYDLSQEMDRALVSLIAEIDIQLVANEILRPTALFGIFR